MKWRLAVITLALQGRGRPKSRCMMSACFAWFLRFQRLLIIPARIAPSDFAIPPWMMGPGPRIGHCSVDHRAESSGFAGGALINVDHKSTQHDQSRGVVE